jgi:hypothetical protein
MAEPIRPGRYRAEGDWPATVEGTAERDSTGEVIVLYRLDGVDGLRWDTEPVFRRWWRRLPDPPPPERPTP